MKNALKVSSVLVAVFALVAPVFVLAGQARAKARVLLVEGGNVLARDSKSGRTFAFTVPADVASGLKVGDPLEADLGAMTLVSIKGTARSVAIKEPDAAQPCCAVVAFAKDGLALHSLLNSLSGSTAVNASQIDLKTLVANGGPVLSFVDPAEPITGVVLVRDTKSGAHHVVLLSGAPPAGAIGSPIVGDTVIVDERVGFAAFRTNNQLYSFPLWRPDTAEQGPWVITPNPSLSGINGRLVTKFAEKTDSAARVIRVFTPGTEDEVSMAVLGEDQTLIEGEYDVKVMRVVVPKVPIKRGHETRVLIGAIAFASRDQDLHYIYDAKGEKQLFYLIGYETVSVPAGKYSLKAGNRVVPFEVKDGQVTTL